MKTINNNIASKFALAAFLALGTLAVTSCSKDNNQTGQEIPTGNSQLIVRIAGISDGENISTKGAKGSTSKTSASTHSIELVQSNGFDAIVAVDNNVPATQTTPIAGLKAANGKRAASTPMLGGTKYRLFLYKKNGATYTYDQSVDFSSGTEAPVTVTKGATYKWIAISYNSTSDLVQDRGINDTFTLPENKDVLYAASAADFTVGESVEPINISFNRLYARIAVEVNTLGMFAPMNSAKITVTGQSARSATVDLTTGTLTLAPSAGVPELTEADFTDIDGDASRKVAYYYTADPAAQNLTVKVTDLSIKLDDGNDRTFGSTALTQIKSITPVLGQNHRFLVGIAESALTYGTTKWARSNLYYRTTDALGATIPYRFYHTNPLSPNKQESFFSFRGHLPGRLATSTEVNQKDPCTLVYPAGLWKTPTDTQIGTLTSNQGVLDGLLGSVLGLVFTAPGTPGAAFGPSYIEYTPTVGVNAAYGSATSATNKLRFQYNGLQNNISVVSGLINVSLGDVGQTAAVWSSSRVLDGGLLALLSTGVGAWGYLGSTAPARLIGLPPRPERAIASKGAGVLNLAVVGLDVAGSGFMNVRCVRDAAWTVASQAANYNPMPIL
ncbi:hypothetical protein ACFX5U_20140 [Sphingobacterium sp. SG20118]|uniref:hypothetical protein n=1 Tax=Sphingobacterium sp. SG20118 TaxID=3367156 RepID=UPI0037DFC4C2